MWMWQLGTWAGAGLGSAGGTFGHDDLRGPFSIKDSVIP